MSAPKRLYLAGPVRGVDDYRKHFAFTTAKLRLADYKVFNPIELDSTFELAGVPADIRVYMKHDLAWICDWAEVVALLPGWRDSSGALAEYYTAKAIGVATWVLPPEYCL